MAKQKLLPGPVPFHSLSRAAHLWGPCPPDGSRCRPAGRLQWGPEEEAKEREGQRGNQEGQTAEEHGAEQLEVARVVRPLALSRRWWV